MGLASQRCLDQASADLNTCSASGPDATFSFTLEEVVLRPHTSDLKTSSILVIVSLSDLCGGAELAGGFGVEEVLEAGTSYHSRWC